MLRVVLRPITGGDPQLYCFCQRCGGAIAAEYLYIQNSGKAELGGVSPDPDLRPNHGGENAEIPTSGVVLDSAAVGTPAPAPGETETLEASIGDTESPSRVTKKGRKESH